VAPEASENTGGQSDHIQINPNSAMLGPHDAEIRAHRWAPETFGSRGCYSVSWDSVEWSIPEDSPVQKYLEVEH
jgi:hypothetical protein